jgi:hypothetical protein
MGFCLCHAVCAGVQLCLQYYSVFRVGVWAELRRRNQLGRLFSSELDVVMLTAQAVPPLAVSLIGELLFQPVVCMFILWKAAMRYRGGVAANWTWSCSQRRQCHHLRCR